MTLHARRQLIATLACGIALSCDSVTEPSADRTAWSGGDMTVFDATSSAFGIPAPNLSTATLERHLQGDAQFEAAFVTAPAPVNPGLGPAYNNVSCESCHPGDGRGRPPATGQPFASILLRISTPGMSAVGGPQPAPGFGLQLQPRAIIGTTPEATPLVEYDDIPGVYGDGEPYVLQRPRYELLTPYAPLPVDLLVSPRVAPPVFGLGLLEAVPEADVISRADPLDGDGDGISGRPNYVLDPTTGQMALGRFGWKASAASLLHQVVGAYNEDMGVTTPALPDEPCSGQLPQCDGHPPDIPIEVAELVRDYVQTLGVPARRQVGDPVIRAGEDQFRALGCSNCHAPLLRTGAGGDEPAVANQEIRPFTDLLLHDMGDGLADGRPDWLAGEREWRTPPLWGIGLTMVVSGHTRFLHDGRARTLAEAILWHGGEAAAAAEGFRNLPAAMRAALLAFLGSL